MESHSDNIGLDYRPNNNIADLAKRSLSLLIYSTIVLFIVIFILLIIGFTLMKFTGNESIATIVILVLSIPSIWIYNTAQEIKRIKLQTINISSKNIETQMLPAKECEEQNDMLKIGEDEIISTLITTKHIDQMSGVHYKSSEFLFFKADFKYAFEGSL